MSTLRIILCFIRWDFRREIRRKETIVNMILFAVLILFIVDLGIGPIFDQFRNTREPRLEALKASVSPVFFWIALLFAGTVGLSHSFAQEREENHLDGIVLAPIDLGGFYIAKVIATWVYVMIMELCLLGVYVVLFDFSDWARLGPMLAIMSLFTLGYLAAGVLLAAMTTALRRGGEVVLRILLFPLLLPILYVTLRTPAATFGVDVMAGYLGRPFGLAPTAILILAIDTLYLTAGYLVFPKILEE